jgi:hypothetical protein
MKLIFTSCIAAAYASVVCNQDGSVLYTYPKGSGFLNTYTAGSCTNAVGGGLTHEVVGDNIEMTLGKDCFSKDGLSFTTDVKHWYSLSETKKMIFRSKENTLRCGIGAQYTARYDFNGVSIENTDDKTNEVSDIGFSFAIKRFTDNTFLHEETDKFVRTGEEVHFKVYATRSTDGYMYEVPNCRVEAGSNTPYDLWKLNDSSYCVEDFASTSLNSDNEASFTTFTFDTDAGDDYSIVCDIRVCEGSSGCGFVDSACEAEIV